MKLPEVEWRRRPGMDRLLKALGAGEGETRFVGGCVRDTLLGLEVSDVDLATRLKPEAVMARLKEAGIKAVPTGLAHGTVTAVSAGTPVEVTTLRRDVATDGRRATVAFTDDWQEDAARRDFTINALSVDPLSGEVFDYFGGADDLAARRVRFIGDPFTRIAEDHLRILRFFRFHARFGIGAPDEAGLEACVTRANDLMALSRERVADELSKLLALADPSATCALMERRGVFAPVLPEISAEGVDALRRLIGRERRIGVAADVPRRLAAMLPRDAEVASHVAARLRLANAWRQLLALYARPPASDVYPRALAYRHGKDQALSLLLLGDADEAKLAEDAARLGNWAVPLFPLKGGELVGRGLPKGPVVAQTLERVKREWIESEFDDEAVPGLVDQAVAEALRSSQ
jgi:poly(A) polymerase